ncbi:MAG: undecaprenyldiphospho-muramoylpentapeptide beta-N-acetylglucosaminyltransferase [Bacteroidota bacterium]|nr:undecaprenyldiphospho-muramoylpentapeptide beta-N-acetylglucosaminyltransferase [Bacteroidota bacterium]MDP4233969.1 undecaprenyldiphospho-muramoylpentapeptide beta-N-acetylglucosaminyltransferase [Bacteroidota bacterium]MDP4242780.1 undecaprenyldiphospho-muramoylpentapeptide beta-N-acetylglucosaminyltransferase [Bacteroidota bacterium]MDP4288494.1 undecaprenyldiphospho-muramoylpentapeptide beta-N-acetylglucosaminyltransferase [Bacteroidota bacterium]
MPERTILIAAGGTGGHLYPALAVAEEIRRERTDVRVIFVGTHDRIESREVPRAGFPFNPIAIEAPRKSATGMIKFPFDLARATLDCMRLMARERPAVMLGGGAYLSVPAGVAAWTMRVPIALLEINSIAGSANKFLAPFADQLFAAYHESLAQFPNRLAQAASVCGTPVRLDLGALDLSKEDARTSFGLDPTRTTILVFGGSLGARPINQAMELAASELATSGYNVLWQTGKSSEAEILREKFQNQPNVRATEYIYEMERAYRAADLVVCRAGASSLAELARLAKPAVLVPWSGAMANHQEMNALAFERDGAAVVLRDNEVKDRLLETVRALLCDPEQLRSMAAAMRHRDTPNAANIVAQWLLEKVV